MSSSAGIRDKPILGPAARNLSSRPDLSQLKTPIRTSLSGTKQVIHALECGTGEVKEYLLEEINLMYECKTCFSVFRSIANLVAHKRTFCKSKYASLHHVYDDQQDRGGSRAPSEVQTVVVEAEPVECVVEQQDISLDNYSPSLELLKTAGVLKDISNKPVINRLLPPGKPGLTSVVNRLRARQEGVDSQHYQHRVPPPPPVPVRPDLVVHLEPIYETDSGLMQSWRVSEEGESLGQTYRAWQEAEQEKQCYKVWPNGQVTSSKETIKLVAGPGGETFSVRVPCDSLVDRVEDIESEEEDCGYTKYPCPSCRKSYSKIMSVFRHMVAVHDITMQEAKAKRKIINNQSVYVEGRRKAANGKATFSRPVKPVNVTLKNFTLESNKKTPVNLCDKLNSSDYPTHCPILSTSCLSDSEVVVTRDKHKADALNRLVREREEREKEEGDLDEEVDRKLSEFVNRRTVGCRVCGEQFSRTFILKNHIAGQHLRLERWRCRFCEFGSWSRYQCVNHAVLEHKYSNTQSALDAVQERTKEEYFDNNPHCLVVSSSRSETPQSESERVNGEESLVNSPLSNSPDSRSGSEETMLTGGKRKVQEQSVNYNIKRRRRESAGQDSNDEESTLRLVFSKVSPSPSVSPTPPLQPRPGPRSRTRQSPPSTGPSREGSESGSDMSFRHSMDTLPLSEMSLLQHASSLLLNLQRLHLDCQFSDLQIFCDDGVIQSYRVLLGSCSDLVRACLTSSHTETVDTVETALILPGLTVSDLQTFHRCIYSDPGKISQADLETGLRVMLALGGDIRRYLQLDKPSEEPGRVKASSKPRNSENQIKTKQTANVNTTTTYTLAVNEKDEIVSKSGPKFACSKCCLEFDQETDLEAHCKVDCSKQQHFCESCNKAFSSAQTFTNHMKLHSAKLEYKCPVCLKSYVSRSVLGNHMKTHDESNKVARFNCSHCEKKFNHPSNLKRHVRTAHFEVSDKKIYVCPDCGKTFKDPSARKHHLKTHLEVRPHPCQGCDKSFATKSQLESHVRIHTGEKPFVCSVCGRCFVTKGQLKSHKLNRHVGVSHSKSHLCQDCGQSFVKEYDLKVHMRKHTGERPFQCRDCGKTFRSERNLTNHQRIHTGDKPYRCETCGKGFASCAGLRQHFKSHSACRLQATEGAYCKQDRKTNRYGRVRLDSIPELPLVETGSTGLQSLQTFSVSELKPPEDSGVEETVVYFNTDSGLGIGIEGVTIQGGLEEVTNIDGVTIQAIGLDVGEEGQVLSLVQIDEGMTQI